MDGYERLANAIVAQAEKDYIVYKKELAKVEKLYQASKKQNYKIKCDKLNGEIHSIVDFFHSQWFTMLSDKDGDMILKKLEDYYERTFGKTL